MNPSSTIKEKGQACHRCKTRRVKCTGEGGEPCRACLRSAKFKGHDLDQVYCAYPNLPGPKRCSEEAADAPSSRVTRRRRKAREVTPESTSEEEDEDTTTPPPPPKRRRPAPRAYEDDQPVASTSQVIVNDVKPSNSVEMTTVKQEEAAPSTLKVVVPSPPEMAPRSSSFAAHRSGLAQMHLELPTLFPLATDSLQAAATSADSASELPSEAVDGKDWSSAFLFSGSTSPALPSSSYSVSSRSSTASPAESPFLHDYPFDFGAPMSLVDDYFFGPSVPQIASDPMVVEAEGAGGISTPYWYGHSAEGWPARPLDEGKGGMVAMGQGLDSMLLG